MAEEQHLGTYVIRIKLSAKINLPNVAITTKDVVNKSRIAEEFRSKINGLRLVPPLVNVNAYIQYIPPLSVCSASSTCFVIGTCLFSGWLKNDEKVYGFI